MISIFFFYPSIGQWHVRLKEYLSRGMYIVDWYVGLSVL